MISAEIQYARCFNKIRPGDQIVFLSNDLLPLNLTLEVVGLETDYYTRSYRQTYSRNKLSLNWILLGIRRIHTLKAILSNYWTPLNFQTYSSLFLMEASPNIKNYSYFKWFPTVDDDFNISKIIKNKNIEKSKFYADKHFNIFSHFPLYDEYSERFI